MYWEKTCIPPRGQLTFDCYNNHLQNFECPMNVWITTGCALITARSQWSKLRQVVPSSLQDHSDRNYDRLCPHHCKITVIKIFLHRAYSICSSWELFHDKLRRIQQVLINNNFPNYIVDKQITKFLNENIKIIILPMMLEELNITLQKWKLIGTKTLKNAPEDIKLYLRSQFTNNYKVEEK